MKICVHKLSTDELFITDEVSVFNEIDFNESTYITADLVSEVHRVCFAFPVLARAKRDVKELKNEKVAEIFTKILANYILESEKYYQKNPDKMADHINYGWIKDPETNNGSVH